MKALKNSWDLSLLYKSEKDPQIEKDLKAIEIAFEKFEKKYKGKDFTSSSIKLSQAIKDRMALEEVMKGSKPWWYFALRNDLNSDDKVAGAKATSNNERLTLARNKIAFFKLAIAKIPKPEQKKLLNDKKLEDFKYFLRVIFDEAEYLLTEEEEQLSSLLANPGYGMWIKGQNKLLSQQTVSYKGKKLPIPEATSILSDEPKKDRDILHKELTKVLSGISHFAEAEINAIYNFKKIMDERRGFEKPYSATVLDYENDEETVENLVSLVTKNFKISHRFYRLHKKLLKEKKLTLSDRGVAIGKIDKKFEFEKAVGLVKRAFERIDHKFVEIFERFLDNAQIDVYPKKGKKGGAYCWGMTNAPTFVLLNHTGNINSVGTLAHEMGHAFHTELSKSQPIHYQGYTTSTAETASTFFEQVLDLELEKELTDKERVVLLHNKIMGDMSTIFRQIAFFNFELELHNKIRKEGEVSKEEIAKLMSKHLKSYLGDAFEITEEDGYFFVYLSHMRRFFYVYSYAYGQLISRALFEKWKEDKSFSKKIEQFLRAGGSMSPKDIFKSIGIDTSDPEFFRTGLKSIEKDIDRLEKLISR